MMRRSATSPTGLHANPPPCAGEGSDGAGATGEAALYGWFTRIGRGTYALTDRGHASLGQFADAVSALAEAGAEQAFA